MEFMFQLSPGHGEIFENQYITLGGCALAAHRGDPRRRASSRSRGCASEDDPARFDAALLDAVLAHAPLTAERVDRASFGLAGLRDYPTGAVTPVVGALRALGGEEVRARAGRSPHHHDPITGQGREHGHARGVAGRRADRRAGAAGAAFDEAFCADLEDRLWARSGRPRRGRTPSPPRRRTTRWPSSPRPRAASTVADAFATNFVPGAPVGDPLVARGDGQLIASHA